MKEIFPVPLMIVDDVCTDYLGKYETVIDNLFAKCKGKSTDFQNVRSTHGIIDNLYDHPGLTDLVQKISTHSYDFMVSYGMTEDEIKQMRLRTMWANRSNKDDYLFPHIHTNSILSGVFYVKASTQDKLIFFKDKWYPVYQPLIESRFSKRTLEIDCVPGRLVIFLSDLQHGTTRKVDDHEKLCFSFNITLNINT